MSGKIKTMKNLRVDDKKKENYSLGLELAKRLLGVSDAELRRRLYSGLQRCKAISADTAWLPEIF